MFEFFWETVERARHAAVNRKEVRMLPTACIKSDPFPALTDGRRFVPGAAYFGVRLAGLHVVDARKFGTQRLPLLVSLAEFKQRGKDRSIPFSIGPREILQKLADAGAMKEKDASPGWIELRDITVVPPTPVGAGNLSLFLGLYTVPGSDVVDTLLDVVAKLGKSVGVMVPDASTVAIDVAKSVYAGFGALVGLKSLEALVQAETGRALPEAGSGYLVLANAPPDSLNNERTTVCEGKLCRDGQMITDLDYCLVAIELYPTILEEGTGTAPDLFDTEWQQVVKELEDGPSDRSKTAMRRLQSAIRSSPALIDSDRTAAMGAYMQLYVSYLPVEGKLLGAGGDLTDTLTESVTRLEGTQAGDKLGTIMELLDAVHGGQINKNKSSIELARQTRAALIAHGEGADEALADALLRAI